MNYPKSLTLVCKVTGVTVKYTNAAIIKKKCDEAGSVESFVSNFVSQRAISAAKRSGAGATITAEDSQYTAKGAGKTPKVKASFMKPILQAGVEMGKMTAEEYAAKYPRQERTYAAKGSDVIATVYVAQ
jgi:hypothetical protein